MKGYKKIILAGNITAKPELRKTNTDGKSVTDFSLAVNNPDNSVDFFPVVLWDELAVNACKFLDKGSPVLVEGYPYYESYEPQDGPKRKIFKVRASVVRYLPDGKRRNTDADQDYSGTQDAQDIEDDMPF